MSTPAATRFERLFAHKQRPAKPVTQLEETVDNDEQQTRSSKATDVPSPDNSQPDPGQPQHLGQSTGSEDDDEYAAAFSKATRKPEMKTRYSKTSAKATSGVDIDKNTVPNEQPRSAEFLPTGKASVTKRAKDELFDAIENERINSYDGDGHTLVGQFCLFTLVAKFPYKYMNDPDNKVSQRFFANGKFYTRTWRLHYLRTPQSLSKPFLILVSLDQVQELIDEIALAFQVDVSVPPFPFTLSFYDDGTPSPVLLGITSSKDSFSNLQGGIMHSHVDETDSSTLTARRSDRAYEAYHEKIEKALLACKVKKFTSSSKKSRGGYEYLQESGNQIRRAQRYFGLRPPTKAIESVPGLSWEEEKTHQRNQLRSCGLLFDFLNVQKKTPHSFQHDPVVISIDVEWYEHSTTLVTEIGVSVLDTLDLVDLQPGVGGENWTRHIRSRHFRVKGREHLINKDFCVGYPDGFDFGTSEFVDLHETGRLVDSCLQWPFCVGFKSKDSRHHAESEGQDATSNKSDAVAVQRGAKQRNIVIVGHSITTDLNHLQRLGSEIFCPQPASLAGSDSATSDRHSTLASILETLDTATLYQALRGESQPRSLGYICNKLGIDVLRLHNAGNDAYYTLEALVGILVKARLEEDEHHRVHNPSHEGVLEDPWKAEEMRRIDDRLEHARQKFITARTVT